MKRLTILSLANVLVIIILTSMAASAQWTVTKVATLNAVVGDPFVLVPPATTASVPLSSSHDAKVEYTGTGTGIASAQISLRLFVNEGQVTYTTGGTPVTQPSTNWMNGDAYYVNGFFPNGVGGGQLTKSLSGSHDFSLGNYTPKAFTHILVNMTAYNADASGSFQVKN